MRRLVVFVPGLVSSPELDSVLRQKLPNLEQLAEDGELFRLAIPPTVETPEAFLLGLGPREGQLRQGPLTISALNADPPDDSTQFHLTLASLSDDTVSACTLEPSEDELKSVFGLAERLNIRLLTVVKGELLDHGLVWENRGDLGTTALVDSVPFRESLPEGDGENLLRRFIDDSVNLLHEQDFNLRRIDQGLPPYNILWPWGHGHRTAVPNLFLRRGRQALVVSGSMRLAGLTRLASYRHIDRSLVGKGTNTKLRNLADRVGQESASIVYLQAANEFRVKGQFEELDWFVREFDREFLGPILDTSIDEQIHITLITNELGFTFDSKSRRSNSIPFDERALEDTRLRERDLWTSVNEAL